MQPRPPGVDALCRNTCGWVVLVILINQCARDYPKTSNPHWRVLAFPVKPFDTIITSGDVTRTFGLQTKPDLPLFHLGPGTGSVHLGVLANPM